MKIVRSVQTDNFDFQELGEGLMKVALINKETNIVDNIIVVDSLDWAIGAYPDHDVVEYSETSPVEAGLERATDEEGVYFIKKVRP